MTDTLFGPEMKRGAVISACGLYRYRLSRIWDDFLPLVGFIMLNPSTADADVDDPTIRRCVGFAKDWGYGGIVVGNLFAFRATNPDYLCEQSDPIGPENDAALKSMRDECAELIAAWGSHGFAMSRAKNVREMIGSLNWGPLHCLKKNADGQPAHPLYLPKNLTPILL